MPELPSPEKFWSANGTADDVETVGKAIFERVQQEARPDRFSAWASGILRLAYSPCGESVQPIDAMLSMLKHPEEWHGAHDAFSALRRELLKLDEIRKRTPQERILHLSLYVAELIAKVTYNRTDPPDPFDEDSGWWIAPCMRDLARAIGKKEFDTAVWAALIS